MTKDRWVKCHIKSQQLFPSDILQSFNVHNLSPMPWFADGLAKIYQGRMLVMVVYTITLEYVNILFFFFCGDIPSS